MVHAEAGPQPMTSTLGAISTYLDSMQSGVTNPDLLWGNLMCSLDEKITQRE